MANFENLLTAEDFTKVISECRLQIYKEISKKFEELLVEIFYSYLIQEDTINYTIDLPYEELIYKVNMELNKQENSELKKRIQLSNKLNNIDNDF